MVPQEMETQEKTYGSMKKAAVIILNWNGEKLLREFLPSVVQHTDPQAATIYVVDNYSSDNSCRIVEDEFPDVRLIRFNENYGFAGGYNRAIEQIEAEYVFLLNSDVELSAGWLEPLVDLLDNDARVAAVQPKIKAYLHKTLFEYAGACGGYLDKWGFPFCRGRIMDVTEEDFGQYDNVESVAWCSGAALFIRRGVYRKAGGLDERFFAHMEEIDLCWRIRNMGYVLKVVPSSVVYHLGGGTLPMNHPRKLFLNYRNNLLMLHKNLDKKTCRRVLFGRKFFDTAALMIFLLKGEWKNVKAIVAAYREYGKMKHYYRVGPEGENGMWQGSIVFRYYLYRKRKYAELG